MTNNKKKDSDYENVYLVYSGRRNGRSGTFHLWHYVIDGLVGDELAFKGRGVSGIIGKVYVIPQAKDGSGWLFSKKKYDDLQEFKNKKDLIDEWRLEDRIVDEQSREKKAAADARSIEDMSLGDIKSRMKLLSVAKRKALFRSIILYLQ